MAAFKTEALTWGQLLHPHVLPVYGAYFFMSEPCLVVPWMKNRNIVEYLRDNIAAYRPQIAIDVVQGLAYLHEHGVIHGRIKGSKIFITKDGRACISDGIMLSAFSTIQSQASQSSAPSNGGSVRWQAPELIDLENDNVIPRTKASDIYALACVFYEIFTGTTPFAHLSKDALVMLNIKAGAKPSRPSDSGPSWTQWGLTQEIWLLMLDCWNTDPANRPTIESVKERLMGLEEHKSEQVVNSFPPGEPLRARMGGPTSLFKVSQHMLCTLVPQALPLIATTPRCVIKEVTMPMMTTLAKTLTSHFGPLKNFEMVFSMRWVLVEFVSIDAARLAIAASPVVLCVDAEETSVSIQHREHDASIVYKAKRRDGPNLKNYTPISRRSAKWDNME
ncbi:hypothetical protein DXG01_008966 [Tephrocybe rancida]|nr:hypothetical protein DXG01_008966 [Tephrocybe rancida]